MQLTIDIGNSALKFALFENKNKQFSDKGFTALQNAIATFPITKAIISNVSTQNEVFELLKIQNIPVEFLLPNTELPIKNKYETPTTLGADRIAVAVAAAALFPQKNVLIICAGSCLTYNFINNEKEFLGGAISPGIAMRFKALKEFTAKLPLLDFRTEIDNFNRKNLIGRNTSNSISIGVLNGVLNEVEGAIEQYNRQYENLSVIITGGNADFFVSNLKNEIFAHPDLVLEGLNSILLYHA